MYCPEIILLLCVSCFIPLLRCTGSVTCTNAVCIGYGNYPDKTVLLGIGATLVLHN